MDPPFREYFYTEITIEEVVCPVPRVPPPFKTDRMKSFAGRDGLDQRCVFSWQCVESVQHFIPVAIKTLLVRLLPQLRNIRWTPQIFFRPGKSKPEDEPVQHFVVVHGTTPVTDCHSATGQSVTVVTEQARHTSLYKARRSVLLTFRWRSHCDGRFSGEQQEGKRLLQVQADSGVGVVGIADGDILANVQLEIAATRSKHKGAIDGGCPDDFILHEPLHVFP